MCLKKRKKKRAGKEGDSLSFFSKSKEMRSEFGCIFFHFSANSFALSLALSGTSWTFAVEFAHFLSPSHFSSPTLFSLSSRTGGMASKGAMGTSF